MHLREYLARRETLTVQALRSRMNELGANIEHDAQIRQWIQTDENGNFKRQPKPANAQILELATDGKVTRQEMRPKDFFAIWPELERRKGPANRRVGPAERRKAEAKKKGAK
jgi:DNA-binding transcriptional regulator YdaS (Cro superfamily)